MQAQTRASDGSLVLLARQGDKGAFCDLLERHKPMLVALCRRMVGNRGLAEDAAQEAYLQALLSLDRLRRLDRFGPWLAGIGLNVCRRWLRERSRDCWSWEAIHGGRAIRPGADPDPGPEELAEAADLSDRIGSAVATLPEGQRAAVTLFYLSGLTYAETAELLGIEVGTVKTRLHKARGALRRRLCSMWKEDDMSRGPSPGAVEVRVADVKRAPVAGDATRQHVLLVEEVGGGRRLPIWVGQFEGTAIAMQLEKVAVPRPLTFDFAARVLDAAGARLREVRISRLAESTFYAVAVIDGPQGVKNVDARPSDAVALALVSGAPILVEAEVFAAAAEEAAHADAQEEAERWEKAPGAAAIAAEVKAGWPGHGRHSGER